MGTAMVVIRCVCLVGEVVVDEEIGEPRHYSILLSYYYLFVGIKGCCGVGGFGNKGSLLNMPL